VPADGRVAWLADYPEVYQMVSSSGSAPGGSRRPVHVLGTLLPHLAAERHHVYRDVTALALLGALIAAGLGSLPVALVLTAVALPTAVLVYIHDHRLWHDEPVTVIVVAFGLSLLLGVGVGLLETYFIPSVTAGGPGYYLPASSRILEVGLVVPVVLFVAVVIAPLVVSARPAFKHPYDVVVAASLSGAALSLGLSVVVQHGAFTHQQLASGDPAHVAFIALTLGFLQPIVFATAATVAVLGLRGLGVNPVVGVVEGLALVVAYELATTLLQPYGTRGIVLTALAAFVLAGAGLLAARNGLHAAVSADSGAEVPDVEHRLHHGVVTAVVAVTVLVAAVVSVAVAWQGPATRPKPPQVGPGGIVSHHAAGAGFLHPSAGLSGPSPWGRVALRSTQTPLATGTATAITLYKSVAFTPASGWTVAKQGNGFVVVENSDQTATLVAIADAADSSDINQQASELTAADIKASGMTDVQQKPLGAVQTIQGNNFQQVLEIAYQGNIQTSQGSGQTEGVWTILFSSSSNQFAFADYNFTSEDAFNATKDDVNSMLSSMA
jgi:hypothetical protein